MKKLLFFLFLSPVFCNAQEKEENITEEQVKNIYDSLPMVDGKYEWTEVVQLDSSFKKELLYNRAKRFFMIIIKNHQDDMQYDEKLKNKVLGKGSFEVKCPFKNQNYYETRYVDFEIEINCKDGEYTYRLYNVSSVAELTHGNPHHTGNSEIKIMDIAEAYKRCNIIFAKKVSRKLFFDTIQEIQTRILQLKALMSSK
jgi:hypothetical protein